LKIPNQVKLSLMIVITVVTQVLMLMKSSLVAGLFGASEAMDAFYFSNSIVNFLFGFVAAGISTLIIPEYANHRDRKAVDTFITVVYGVCAAVITLLVLLRSPLIALISGRNPSFVEIASTALIILLLGQYLMSIANVTTAYFQCEGQYNTPKIINLLSQLVVVGALMFADHLTIYEYTWVIAAGMAFNFIFDTAIAVKAGWRFRPTLCFNEESKVLLHRFLPLILSTGIYQLSLMVDSTIAASLETGKVTVLSYSTQIASMANVVLVGNLLTYIYPKITKTIKQQNAQSEFWEQTTVLHAIVCLMIAGFFCVGHEGIILLFLHGTFTAEDCRQVFLGAAIYIFGQNTNVIRDLIYRYFYAVGDSKVPATNSIIVSVSNITVSLLLVWLIGFYGIIIGTITASLISLVVILFRFGKKIGYTEKVPRILWRYLLNLLLTAVTVATVLTVKYFIPLASPLLTVIVYGSVTVVLYLTLQLVFNRRVLKAFKKL